MAKEAKGVYEAAEKPVTKLANQVADSSTGKTTAQIATKAYEKTADAAKSVAAVASNTAGKAKEAETTVSKGATKTYKKAKKWFHI